MSFQRAAEALKFSAINQTASLQPIRIVGDKSGRAKLLRVFDTPRERTRVVGRKLLHNDTGRISRLGLAVPVTTTNAHSEISWQISFGFVQLLHCFRALKTNNLLALAWLCANFTIA
jgi:hypothetical protein